MPHWINIIVRILLKIDWILKLPLRLYHKFINLLKEWRLLMTLRADITAIKATVEAIQAAMANPAPVTVDLTPVLTDTAAIKADTAAILAEVQE